MPPLDLLVAFFRVGHLLLHLVQLQLGRHVDRRSGEHAQLVGRARRGGDRGFAHVGRGDGVSAGRERLRPQHSAPGRADIDGADLPVAVAEGHRALAGGRLVRVLGEVDEPFEDDPGAAGHAGLQRAVYGGRLPEGLTVGAAGRADELDREMSHLGFHGDTGRIATARGHRSHDRRLERADRRR
jgi:hypothetical protein